MIRFLKSLRPDRTSWISAARIAVSSNCSSSLAASTFPEEVHANIGGATRRRDAARAGRVLFEDKHCGTKLKLDLVKTSGDVNANDMTIKEIEKTERYDKNELSKTQL